MRERRSGSVSSASHFGAFLLAQTVKIAIHGGPDGFWIMAYLPSVCLVEICHGLFELLFDAQKRQLFRSRPEIFLKPSINMESILKKSGVITGNMRKRGLKSASRLAPYDDVHDEDGV